MYKLIIVILILFISACSKNKLAKEYYVHPEFTSFIKEFYGDAAMYGINFDKVEDFKVVFGELGSEYSGLCRVESNGDGNVYRTIFIDKTRWNMLGYWARKALIYHEASHCLLNIFEHDDRMDEDNHPLSLINSYDFYHYEDWLMIHWGDYVVQLFEGV